MWWDEAKEVYNISDEDIEKLLKAEKSGFVKRLNELKEQFLSLKDVKLDDFVKVNCPKVVRLAISKRYKDDVSRGATLALIDGLKNPELIKLWSYTWNTYQLLETYHRIVEYYNAMNNNWVQIYLPDVQVNFTNLKSYVHVYKPVYDVARIMAENMVLKPNSFVSLVILGGLGYNEIFDPLFKDVFNRQILRYEMLRVVLKVVAEACDNDYLKDVARRALGIVDDGEKEHVHVIIPKTAKRSLIIARKFTGESISKLVGKAVLISYGHYIELVDEGDFDD